MPTASERDTVVPVSIQLLLFVDERPSSQENVQQIQSYLQSLKTNYPWELQVIEIAEQPHLVEHFRLVATPALVKIAPEPKQTLAGSNLVNQLKKWWPRWQLTVEDQDTSLPISEPIRTNTISGISAVGYSAELVRLTDEIFRLKKEKEELLEQLKFKDQVLAMLAHDLRSPLTAASMSVETVEITLAQPETERTIQLRAHLFLQAKKQFRIMNRMIVDILQASKSMNRELHLQSSPLHLQSLCEDILEQFTPRFLSKSLAIETDIPQDLPLVFADEELIRQVIVNLLDNAVKYTPEQGKITVSILHRTTQKVQVTIADTGLGIPEEKKERVFEGHFRLKRDEEKEGYGLGLSLCRKIIQAHYGQIWVDSVPNGGSYFHFTLPVYR